MSFHFELTYAKTQQDVADAIERHINRNVLAAPPKPREVSDGLKSAPRPFAGIKADIKRRLPHYLSDFKDGLRAKSIASIVFMFFACLAPAITFGGLLGDNTNGAIGTQEMLISTAVCGVVYALVAGQPLIILGGIGPMLIFTIILYQLCEDLEQGHNFLGIYGWVGIWTACLTCLLAIGNASNLMKYFTRFTDEIFSALMSLIFIYKAVEGIIETFENPGSGGTEKALLALILAIGTFYIAMSLARFRSSIYLFPWMREFLADFGPSIALACMIGVAWWLGDASTVDTLSVGGATETAKEGGSWFVNLGQVPLSLKLIAIGPAILATVLIFLSQNITARLVNSPGNHLVKGESYHWDLAVIGGLVGLCSLFGWPWMVAATVRSLAHVRSPGYHGRSSWSGEPPDRDHSCHRESHHSCRHSHSDRLDLTRSRRCCNTFRWQPCMASSCSWDLFHSKEFSSSSVLAIGSWTQHFYPVNHYTRRVPTRTIHLFTLCAVDLLDRTLRREPEPVQPSENHVPDLHRLPRTRSRPVRPLHRQGSLGIS